MTDFAISIKNLPPDHMWNHDENVLKAYLRAHFEAVIKDYMLKNNLEITKILDSSNFDKDGYNKYEIVDICFGKQSMKELDHLDKLADLRNKFLLHKLKMDKCIDEGMMQKLEKEKLEIETEFDQYATDWKEKYKNAEDTRKFMEA